MKIDFSIGNIMGFEGWERVRERYPALVKALRELDIADVDIDSEGYLTRALETVVQQIREYQDKRWGVRCQRWRAYGPKRSNRWGERVPADWLDHSYKARYPMRNGSGKTVYVSEPYRLSGESIKHLARLVDKGCEVTVTAWEATYYPGHTLHVGLTQADGSRKNLAGDILDTYQGGREF
jgi:hypothetical protein